MKDIIKISLLFILTSLLSSQAFAHCQIPCGIYGDDARFTALLEDVTTIRKAVDKIGSLSKEDKKNYNQIVRWVNTRESHADNISDVVLKYFLQQRIKPSQDHYQEKLVALHKIVVLSMKVKQSTNMENVDGLEKSIHEFHELYHHHHE